jgi:lysophospholipase L1-like esterase
MVLGDSMADWLGYGLEEAFSDSPEIAIVRKTKLHSGLIRYEPKSDLDWWHVARDLLSKEKVDFVVMMLGVDDRTSIRESQAERDAAKKEKDEKAGDKGDKKGPDAAKDDNDEDAKADDDAALIAPEPKRGANPGVAEFRTERWEQIYTRRIDDTIAALKSKGVPVLWVGLPSIRGTRSTADAVYLNDLYRARAEKAGIVYVDVWDGFIDEAGKFTYTGPDFEGQIRRLRSGDGVHFTKNGARKLAHYVERELRRFIANRALPMALPSGGQQLQGTANEPAARPVAGPVMPLTGVTAGGEDLLGGGANRPVHSDPVATRVLVKGEPVAPTPGRADDFKWPRGADTGAVEPLSPTAAAARAEPAPEPKAAPKSEPKDKTSTQEKDASRGDGKAAGAGRDKPASTKPAAAERPKAATKPTAAADPSKPRPPAPLRQSQPQPPPRQSGGLFGLFR